MTPPDRELISQSAARRLLDRAGQIDVDTTSVESLRAAAREAGISEAAFDTALAEMRSEVVGPPMPLRTKRKAIALSALSAVAALLLLVMIIIPNRNAGPTEIMESQIQVKCIPMLTAKDIAARMAKYDGSDIYVEMSPGSGILKVRGSRQAVENIQREISSMSASAKTCVSPP